MGVGWTIFGSLQEDEGLCKAKENVEEIGIGLNGTCRDKLLQNLHVYLLIGGDIF